MEREKPRFLSLSVSALPCARAAPRVVDDAGGSDNVSYKHAAATPAHLLCQEDRQENGYVPTVGRWGSEWPS
uniref:Putative secreted protein n=1 Tax=Xenopsylla cheopis TaxID=163159 RepID=A0A6M2E366_XENCH